MAGPAGSRFSRAYVGFVVYASTAFGWVFVMKHLKLTASERAQFNSTRKKYDAQYRALEKQERDADKAGTSDAAILSQLEQLRAQERAELRGFLTAGQQAQFDRNAASWPKH